MPKLEIRLFRLLDDGSLQLAPRRSIRIRRVDPYSRLSYMGRSEAHECLGAIGMAVPDHPDRGSDCIQLGVVEPTYAGRSHSVLVMGREYRFTFFEGDAEFRLTIPATIPPGRILPYAFVFPAQGKEEDGLRLERSVTVAVAPDCELGQATALKVWYVPRGADDAIVSVIPASRLREFVVALPKYGGLLAVGSVSRATPSYIVRYATEERVELPRDADRSFEEEDGVHAALLLDTRDPSARGVVAVELYLRRGDGVPVTRVPVDAAMRDAVGSGEAATVPFRGWPGRYWAESVHVIDEGGGARQLLRSCGWIEISAKEAEKAIPIQFGKETKKGDWRIPVRAVDSDPVPAAKGPGKAQQ